MHRTRQSTKAVVLQTIAQRFFNVASHATHAVHPSVIPNRRVPVTPKRIVNLDHMQGLFGKKWKAGLNVGNVAGDDGILGVCCKPLKKRTRTILIDPKAGNPQSAGFVSELANGIVQAKQRHSPIRQFRDAFCSISANRTDSAGGQPRDDGSDTKGFRSVI
jgi:hypothetical protein